MISGPCLFPWSSFGMRKLIATINLTLDGFCDHTVMTADQSLHQHFSDLLRDSGVILYGRTTYQLMESYWPLVVEKPTGDRSTDEFALNLQRIPKLLFSRTLTRVTWENTTLATRSIEEEVQELKHTPGKDIVAGSPSMIVALTNLKLVDEYQLCIHPVIAGGGLPLFRGVTGGTVLKRIGTKAFDSGAVLQCYVPVTRDDHNR